ncbi:MAG TPA: filamentous hemagglutinin N-terminal domain-containing protein [Stenotrophomonas sp.]|nr:filamentous hemagglutinin N-terminal domain-containing protein [Stenotrophomonas sp.]
MHATNHASHCPGSPRAIPLRHRPLALALAACLTAGLPTAVMAQVSAMQLPTGGSIVGGTGSINAASGGSQSITQTSNRMALTWSAFDIGSSATVTFNQPSSNAAVLNLIQGGNPTQIFGNLNANGQVFLINTNGMIFGSTAKINVGGLVASTLDTTASDFMTGNDVLDAGGNTVALMSNSGTINAAAGTVDLIGGKVVNHGTITASAGNINLVGADKVTLIFESGGFGVVVDKALPLQLDSVAVENNGTLSAPGGTITLQARAAQGLFDQLINNNGIIRAAAISGVDGSVSLIANGGGNVGIAGSGSIDVGNGAISISTDRSVQQSGVYIAGTLGGSIGGSAIFSGSNRIATLGMLDVGGTLSLTNANSLTQSAPLTVAGDSKFSLGSNALSLNNAANTFGGTFSATGGNVAVNAAGALTIGSLSQSSNSALSLDAGGRLTLLTSAIDTGSADLTLRSGDRLSTAAALSGSNVSLTGTNGISLAHAVTATGTLALTSSTGAIDQSAGALTVTGTSTIDAGAGAINLGGANNDFGQAISLTGAGVRVVDRTTLQVASLTSAGNTGIDLQAGGSLILPVQALNTGSADLNLVSGGGTLSTRADLRGRNVSLSGRDGITLNHDITSTGTLQLISSAGNINQTGGLLDSGGIATATAGGMLDLGRAGNEFRDSVSLSGTGITVVDQTDLVVSSLTSGANGGVSLTAGSALTLPTQAINTGTADLTLRANGGVLTSNGALAGNNVVLSGRDGISLGGNVTSAGTLELTSSGGAVVQDTGAIDATGAATVDTASGIALNAAGNDFRSTLSLSGNGISVVDQNDLTVSALTNGSDSALSLQAGGALTLPLADIDTGTANLTLRSGTRLTTSGVLAGNNISLTGINGITLGGNVTTPGTLALTSSTGGITQTSGVFDVSGAATINAGTGAVTLANANNDFRSGISLTGTGITVVDRNDLMVAALNSGSNGAVSLTAGGALTLPVQVIDTGSADLTLRANGGALTTGALAGRNLTLSGRDGVTLAQDVTSTGTLAVTTTNAAILQSGGVLDIGSTATLNAGSGAIALGAAGNDFRGAVNLTGSGIALIDRSDLVVSSLSSGSNAAVSLTAGGALVLPAQALDTGTADLTLIANGGGLVTGGTLGGANVRLAGRDGLVLGHAVRSTGALSMETTNAAITQTGGAITAAGSTTVNSGSGGISLTSASNDFAGPLNLSGGATQVRDSNALTLGTLSVDELNATSAGALNLGSGSVRGALTASSGNAAITQSGALYIGGAASLNAGGGDIVLTNADNDFVGAAAVGGNAIALQDRNDLSIAALQSGTNGTVSLVAGGGLNLAVSQIDTGTAALTLAANGGLLQASGPLRGGALQLTGANGIALSDTLTADTLVLSSSNAAITQSGGAVQVAGNTVVDAGTGAITLDAAGNDFQGLLALRGGASTVRDRNALSLGALDTGALQVTSNGATSLGLGLVDGDLVADTQGGVVTQSGALTITGSTRINSGGASIILENAGNDFQSVVSLSGGDSRLRDRNTLALGTLDVGALDVASVGGLDLGQGRIGGALSARTQGDTSAGGNALGAQAATPSATNGAITQQGALTVVGPSVLDAGSGAIVLTDAGNDFQGNVQATGGSVAIVDRNALAVAAQATGALILQAGTQLASTGTLSGGDIALVGGTGVVLGHDIRSTGSVDLRSGGAIAQTGGSLTAGRLSGSATGPVTLTGTQNAIAVLGDFSAQALDVVSNRTLRVDGRVDGGASLRLRSGGELLLDGQLSGASSWLQAVAGIRQRAGSWIEAGLLSGSAGGAVVLGDASSFIDNRIDRLGNFTAGSGFSLTNAGDLLLVLADGGAYSVDAGNSPLFLSVRGDLLQYGRATLRDGTGTYAATGRMGTQDDPLYVIGTGTQTISAVGAPPAYFHATSVDGRLLELAGTSGFNVPTSVSRVVAFADLSASGAPYRAFSLVRQDLPLSGVEPSACDAGDPDTACSPP